MSKDTDTLECLAGDEQCPVWQELVSLRARVKKLELEVHRDELTGLYNRRHFNHAINQEIERTRRTGQPTSLILLDIDHFKSVNDEYGHPIGDLAIQHVANAISHDLRCLDIACRYGGEEYAIILPGTIYKTALYVAHRLREQIIDVPIILPEGRHLPLRASIGVACTSNDIHAGDNDARNNDTLNNNTRDNNTQQDISSTNLVMRADKALYRAKREGRDRIVGENYLPEPS